MQLLPALIVCLLALQAFLAPGDPPPTVPRVYVEDPAGGLTAALAVLPHQPAGDPAAADTIVLNGVLVDGAALRELLEGGADAVLIMGPGVSREELAAVLGGPVVIGARDDAVSLSATPGAAERAVQAIQWNSSPQVRQRSSLPGAALAPLVTAFESGEMLLGRASIGDGSLYILTPHLVASANGAFREWAYFNYLVYALATPDPVPFADFAGSPVPHAGERTALLAVLAAIILTAVLAFVLVRRYSLRHPEALDRIVDDPERYSIRQERAGWEEVGFPRPLGGFLLAVMLGLILFVPVIIYQNLILPAYILPSAQALGIWGRVTQFFQVAWLFFDMGTSAAFVKYLAEYRVNDPRRGIMYGQLFVWWQALSGAVQVALIVLIASTVLPRSGYAIYAWSVVLHSLIQVPGFFLVYRHALAGVQRFDHAQFIDIAQQILLPMLMQIPIIFVMVRWGQGHPVFGPANGGLLGLGLAAYAVEVLCFIIGWFLWRRIGLRSRVLFMAHFDGRVIRSGFRFGGFEMLGSMAWAAGQAAEIALTQNRLVNYAETWGNWMIAQNFIYSFNVINILFGNLVASISEAISHGRRILSEYYAAQAYRYGGFFSAFIAAVLLAVAGRFILGATGPEFARAALLATPLIIWGAIQYPSWVGDAVQLGSNKPYLKALLVAAEQIVRITLAAIFIGRYQIWALIGAYFVGLLAKGIAAFIINNRVCFPQRIYAWPALAAPILAGVTHYAVLRWVTGLVWQGDQVTSVAILFIGILLSLPLFAFLYGFFGGWSGPALAELRRGAELAGFMRPIALLFWRSSAQGAAISPLRGRAAFAIQAPAEEEAAQLMAERVDLQTTGGG